MPMYFNLNVQDNNDNLVNIRQTAKLWATKKNFDITLLSLEYGNPFTLL